MNIALAQFNPTVGDFEGNSTRILELAHEAQSRGAELAVFSELCLCGYPPQDLSERPAFDELNQKELLRLAKKIPLPSDVYKRQVHMSLMTATMCGLRFRRVFVPSEIGSYFAISPFKNGATSGVMSGTQPPANWLLPSFSSERAGKSIT